MTPPRSCSASRGYTLVEILVATALTLMMMAAVVQIFGLVGESVSDSRATLEMNDRIRAATNRLQMDLAGVTASTVPPLRMSEDPGYFEYVEGPLGASRLVSAVAIDTYSNVDPTVLDFDDILMFTTRSSDQPFIGRYNGGTTQSQVAEVAWFVRGGKLYRRVLLVLPGVPVTSSTSFYQNNDISVRNESGTLRPNSLGDLTRRECRYGHPVSTFPYSVQNWGWYGLPTLGDTSNTWTVGQDPPVTPEFWSSTTTKVDFWTDPQPTDTTTTSRALEDVVLSNVIGFDVKAWDPRASARDSAGNVITGAYGAYVDLGSTYDTSFSTSYDSRSGLTRTYDTWTDYYEASYYDASTLSSPAMNGFDDNSNGVVDDVAEAGTAPPYSVPLRGIQVRIRTFEPDSRQIREVTIVQDFMPK